MGWSPEKIRQKTGIVTRRVAAAGECASDLAVTAAEALFAAHPALREAVDFVLFCTQTPDYLLPTSACCIQHRLGLPTSCGALDVNLGCSGYVYGLALAGALLQCGLARNVLLLTGDTYTRLIHPHDRASRVIFGDGAAATWVAASDEENLRAFVLGTDGAGANNLIVPAGGLRRRASSDTAVAQTDADGNVRAAENLFMDGPQVFAFASLRVPEVFAECLQRGGLAAEDLDLVVLHQTNEFMHGALQRALKLPPEKAPLRLRDIGNTVSASIPFALSALRDEGLLRGGQRLMLVGFGVGYSWGACLATWTEEAEGG